MSTQNFGLERPAIFSWRSGGRPAGSDGDVTEEFVPVRTPRGWLRGKRKNVGGFYFSGGKFY